MSASFAAALAHGADAEVLSIQGNYALNVEDDPAQALRLWRRAAELAPYAVHYQATLARMLIATGRLDEAATQIGHVRRIGRWGQNAQLADDLDRLAAQALSERQTPAPVVAPQAPEPAEIPQ